MIQWSVIGIAAGIFIALVVHGFQAVQGVRRLMKEPHRLAPMQPSLPL